MGHHCSTMKGDPPSNAVASISPQSVGIQGTLLAVAPSDKMPLPTKFETGIMGGVTIGLHGRLHGTAYTHAMVKRTAAKYGAIVETYGQKIGNFTHLITTQREVDRVYEHPKVQLARAKGCPIVSVNWLIACHESRRLVPVEDFLLKRTVPEVDLTGDDTSEESEIDLEASAIIATELQAMITGPTLYPIASGHDAVRALGLRTITMVNKSSKEHALLENYFNFSAAAYAPQYYSETLASVVTPHPTYHATVKRAQVKVRNIYRIERLNEAIRYTNYRKKTKSKYNPRLLWHGSPKRNFAGILKQGIRGDVYERGVYASELAGYSISYSQKESGRNRLGMELMLLCEASISRANTNTSRYRNAGCIHPDLEGVDMLDIQMGEKYPNGWAIQYEHCMPKAEQVRMRYLFQFEVIAADGS